MEEALIAHLLASVQLTDLVSDRVNWNVRPQGKSLPAIVLQMVSSNPDYTHDGASGFGNSRVQMDCWGENYTSAVNVARTAAEVVSGQRIERAGTVLHGVFIDNERQSFEQGNGGQEFHRVSIDLTLTHTEN